MKAEELTWERIKDLADRAAMTGRDFSLVVDADGSVSVDITTPSRTITKAEYEYVPKEN